VTQVVSVHVTEIRALSPEEWPVVRDVRLRSLADAPYAFTSSYERESAFDAATWRDRASNCRWFVAVEDGEVIGVAGGVDGWSGDPATRELVGMWVAPSSRGRGLARSLLDAVAGWARSEEALTLSLGVRLGNDAARLAYLAMGLRPTGEMLPVWNDPARFITVMEMELTP
jgi:GNAT superfamily N-acetyltransferase